MSSEHEGTVVDRRMALAREWDDLVEQVRGLTGFEDFLRPPNLESLLPAAEKGPVVIVNVSRWRCDALVVRREGVTSIPLEQLTLDEATDRANRYLTLLQQQEAADVAYADASATLAREPGRASTRDQFRAAEAVYAAQDDVDAMLSELQEWLWDVVADPVLTALRLTATPAGPTSTWPRIWWCPTGPLTLLPLHTAGYHTEPATRPRRTVLDRVVSSYTPTLRALLQARMTDPAGDDQAAPAEGEDRFLLVEVDAPGQVPLQRNAEHAVLTEKMPATRMTVLAGDQATVAAIRSGLPAHRWVHFSCHGDQNLADPSQGGLLLHDATLTISDVSTQRFHGDFVGLSACKTAVGGVELLDEAITLAAALHYTGYRHVVAALWSVQDAASAEVFADLYREIITDGAVVPDLAPAALHDAVRRLRDSHPNWPHVWTPFTHTGP
ncbi:CHAT domain-containing protein [Streptomyces sp. NPDC059378]|uniref:CHAT domain-containing protein n=1 Tax=Streptomyces sp. NPDC059378 TaxID=3346815 RepID=UPI0036BB6396